MRAVIGWKSVLYESIEHRASSNRTTKQRFINMPGAVIDVIISWTETKILKEKTKWTVRVLKVFTLS